tara:strand:- start:387 stop:1295 length:909 start_codon:yes stop_codon:yes gene_type:complete
LFISSLLWTLLKFSEEREEEVLIDINFINLPKDQILVGDKVNAFPVKIKAQGFDLIFNGFGIDHPKVTIDLSKVPISKKGDVNQYFWLPKKNEEQISKAFDAKVKDMSFPIDTVKMIFSPRITKEVFTKFKFKVDKTKEHFSFGNAVEVPKKIKVIGAKSILNNIDTIYTDLINLESLETNLDEDYILNKPFGVDSLLTDSIRVFIGVESIEKFKFEVPIEVRNKPDSLEVKLFPNEVKITFVCGTNKFSEISPRSFKPYIDFKDIDASFKKISISLDEQPDQVKEVNIEPYSVEYILRTKD